MANSYWQNNLQIKNITVPRFISGPVDGVLDSPSRRVIRSFSPDALIYSEIRHIRSICHAEGGAKALAFDASERPLNFQVTANSTYGIESACEKIMAKGVDAVDLNIGCPARNVTKSGSGSALMADVPLLKEIVTRLRKALPVPFTVKMRAGYKEPNAFEVVQLMQDLGVDAVAIHPRLQPQKFSGEPDYELVAQMKKVLSIPVLYSGGVVDWASAKKVYEMTGVDGFLIGRGMWGKPWKLKELYENSQGRSFTVTDVMRFESLLRHFDLTLEYYDNRGVYMFRKHVAPYVKGTEGATQLVQKIMQVDEPAAIRQVLQESLDRVR